MGKFFDKFKKYASDEDFEDEYFEDDEDIEDEDVEDEDYEDEEVESDDDIEDEDGESDEDFEDEEEDAEDSDDDSVEELEEIDADDEEDSENDDIDDAESEEDEDDLPEEDDLEEEFSEDLDDEVDEEDSDAEEIEEEEESTEEVPEEIFEEDDDSDIEDDDIPEPKPSTPAPKKSGKPSPAEMIAAYYEEDKAPVKAKKTKSNYNGEDEEEDEATIRRRERHKRRIRNQILAYAITLLVLIGIIAGGFLGIRALVNKFKPAVVETEAEESTIEDAIAELNASEEEIVIEAPEIMDEEETEVTEEDYLEEIVEACISAMPLEDKIAQMFIVTPESLTGASKATQAGEKTQEMLKQYPVGGFIYFGGNLVDKEQVMNMISATAGFNLYDMFFAIDEEGGEVSRVSNSSIEVEKVGDMADIGATNDTSKAYEAGKTIGQYLRELGFNVDLAPVADVVTVSENSAIGARSFGSDAAQAGMMAQKCAEGIQENGVSACLKHFPGLGDTTNDTHEERVVIEKSLEELQASNFVAFKQGIDAGVDFVMVSHATATGIDEVYPSSISKDVIKGQLRDYLGYDGIVITDAFNMKAITDYYTTEEACVKAIKAGVDIILMPEDFETGYKAVLEAVKDGSISEERIDESLKRIFRVKKRDEISF